MGLSLFTVLSVILLASALLVILQENPLYSALALAITLSVLAVFFLFLDAELLAVLQILVYAGAIMVLFLFVIMLLNLGQRRREKPNGVWVVTSGAGSTLLVLQLWISFQQSWVDPKGNIDTPPSFGTVREVSRSLFTDFLLPFEMTSLLLLVALIGAVVLAGREKHP
jgi:NADH-quinone oxidoreductase subunit J